MRPLRLRLDEARRRLGLPWEVMERDYLLSWVLAGISRVETLRDTLVFKGGTALRKCHFEGYRFSEDLDFSARGPVPTGEALEEALQKACGVAQRMLHPYAPVEIVCERHVERDPHPQGQEAFDVRARFPWHRRGQVRVMVEVSMDELLLKPPVLRRVSHGYGEPFDVEVWVYPLEEIVAEKLRAILQQMRLWKQRGWVRSRARDYYDLWRILGSPQAQEEADFTGFPELLRKKCGHKGVDFSDVDSFFPEELLKVVETTWSDWLGPLVPELPDFGTVIRELRCRVAELLDPSHYRTHRVSE